MSILLHADDRSWLELPQSFPTKSGESAREWEDRVVRGMRDAWRGAMNPVKEGAVRESLRHALTRVLPEDSVTLHYWPTASVINAIVHIVAREFAPDERPLVVPVDAGPFVAEPVTSVFTSEFLGEGVEARYLSEIETQPPMNLGSVNYLFENSVGYIFVGIDATLPRLVGIMLDPLREVVRTIRVTDDVNGRAWEHGVVEASTVGRGGESWDLDLDGNVLAQ